MPNAIPQDQNSQEYMDLLAASSRIHTSIRRLLGFRSFLIAAVAVIGPALTWWDQSYKVWSGFMGVTVLLVDVIFLEPMAKRWKELGAKIQETFDTKLYHIAWNRLKVGNPPDHEEIVKLAARYRKRHPNLPYLQDWYPTATGQVALEHARIICQRSNLRWDSTLRQTYGTILLSLLCALLAGAIAFGLAMHWSLEQFLLGILVPLLPAATRIWKQRETHLETARESQRCKEHIEGVWGQAIANELSKRKLEQESRALQDEIYNRRKDSTSVPFGLYWFLRKEYQRQMEEAANRMITDANRMQEPV
jgi:hypothetical protein